MPVPTSNLKTQRENDLNQIKASQHPRKVIVAGPGTGKSYLFAELIKDRRKAGKSNFLAITFVGKLGDTLANDLCGLAETMTMHGFARSLVLKNREDWQYYPKISDVIAEDLRNEGILSFEIGDENYQKKSEHYKAVGDSDVVYYAIQICKNDPKKIPTYDMILVDEYQDFNSVESEFVDLLAQKNEIIIVGDDDQALYSFKGSSPSFIRLKYHSLNTDWQSFSLRFCSRCTKAIIEYFHSLVSAYNLNDVSENDPAKKRIEKEYICYLTGDSNGKDDDSNANSQIYLVKNCPVNMIAFKIRSELEKVIKNQKIHEVLIIGEGQSCQALLETVAKQLGNYGFKNVDFRGNKKNLPFDQVKIDAYKLLIKDKSSNLAWRLLDNPEDEKLKKHHLTNSETINSIINGSPSSLNNLSGRKIRDLESYIEQWEEPDNADRERQNEILRKKILSTELKQLNLHLGRPLCNLEITICNILNSKGLGADVVFVIGFDQGRFPVKSNPEHSEIYQMLVAATRAKKRMYLVNTVGKPVSQFADHIDARNLAVEEINVE